jgi:hypothetical protein
VLEELLSQRAADDVAEADEEDASHNSFRKKRGY